MVMTTDHRAWTSRARAPTARKEQDAIAILYYSADDRTPRKQQIVTADYQPAYTAQEAPRRLKEGNARFVSGTRVSRRSKELATA